MLNSVALVVIDEEILTPSGQPTQGKTRKLGFHLSSCTTREHTGFLYSFSRLLWHIFPITVYFFKTAHTQPITEDEITKTLFDVCRMTPHSQNLSHTHQNQTFPSKPTICAQLKMYVFSFIYRRHI